MLQGPGALVLFPQLEEHSQIWFGETQSSDTTGELKTGPSPELSLKQRSARRVQPRLIFGDKEEATSFRCQK